MLLSITLLGFVITLLLLLNIKETNRANLFLFSLLLINNIYSLSHYATVYSGNVNFVAIMLVHFAPFYVLSGPTLYFYVRGLITDDFKLYRKDIIHFIPFILFFINLSGYIFSPWDQKLAYASQVIINPANVVKVPTLFISSEINFLIRPLLGIGYTVYSIFIYFNHFKIDKSTDAQTILISKWLKLLLFVVLTIYISFLFFTIIGFETLDYGLTISTGSIYLYVTIIALFTLNASLLFFPNILYGLPQFDYVIAQIAKQKLDVDPVEDAAKKQSKAFEISNEKLELLKSKVDKYCVLKPYLRADFNLTMMSTDTDIPVHHLSYFFNEYLKINFNTWKNDHKIDYIIELIQGGSNETLTLDALAKQAGFGSRTTFFNAFKQKIGVTPSEYLSKME